MSTITEDPNPTPVFTATRNYTSPREKNSWWYLARWEKDFLYFSEPGSRYDTSKQDFRTRRCYYMNDCKRALRMRFGKSNEIGAFLKLTNAYALIGGEEVADSLESTFKGDLPEIPIINTSLAGCRVIGRMCAGNKNGLIVPETIYNTELRQLKEELPDSVKIQKVEERLSALGNVIACNDSVALVHPDLDKETEEIIGDTLQVEVFRHMIANNALVGSYCVLSNEGGLLSADISNNDLENLSSLLNLSLVAGTVNSGDKTVGSGMVVNDSIAYTGMKTTSDEIAKMETVFHLNRGGWF